MEFLRDISWQEIWNQWQKDELNIWNHLIDQWGFSNWEEWRNSYVSPLHLQQKDWKLFQITPEEILNFECGDFEKWNEISQEVGSRKFKDICQAEVFQNFEKLESLKKDLPKNIQLIGLKNKNTLSIFEGHHRCTSIAQLLLEKKNIDSNITIAITET